jgi:hypothetical protein
VFLPCPALLCYSSTFLRLILIEDARAWRQCTPVYLRLKFGVRARPELTEIEFLALLRRKFESYDSLVKCTADTNSGSEAQVLAQKCIWVVICEITCPLLLVYLWEGKGKALYLVP